MENEAPPISVPGFRIVELIGRGAFAQVFLAIQEELGRKVALKILIDPAAGANLVRFQREARVAAGLVHPNVVRVFAYGTEKGFPWLAMEYLDGGSLFDPPDPPRPPRESLDLAIQAARGVAYLHENGVIHRDLKPGNLLKDREGVLRLGDFGLCRQEDGETALTRPGTMLGTVRYCPPEIFNGESPHTGSDQFALAVSIWEIFSGLRLLDGAHIQEIIRNSSLVHQRRLPDLEISWQPAIDRILAQALACHPADRYPTVSAMLDDLQEIAASLDVPKKVPEVTRHLTSRSSGSMRRGASRSGSGPVRQDTEATRVPPTIEASRSQELPVGPPPRVLLALGVVGTLGLLGLVRWAARGPAREGGVVAAGSATTTAPRGAYELTSDLVQRVTGPVRVLRDARLRTRVEQVSRAGLPQMIATWSGIPRREVDATLSRMVARWSTRVIFVSPDPRSSAADVLRLTSDGVPVSLEPVEPGSAAQASPASPASGALELQLVPGAAYRFQVGEEVVDMVAPPAPASLENWTETPHGFDVQAFTCGWPFEVRVIEKKTARILAEEATSGSVEERGSIYLRPRALPPASSVAVLFGPPRMPIPLFYHVITDRLPGTDRFHEAVRTRFVKPLDEFLSQDVSLSLTLTAGAGTMDLGFSNRLELPDATSMGFQFGYMARLLPDPVVLSRLERILDKNERGRLGPDDFRRLKAGATFAMAQIGDAAQVDRIAARLGTRPSLDEAAILIWSLSYRQHPEARAALPRYLGKVEGARAIFRSWAKIWVWTDPRSFRREAIAAARGARTPDASRRRLFLEGALWLGDLEVVPVLTLLDPRADPPDLRAEAALLLALAGGDAAPSALKRWGLPVPTGDALR